MSMCPYCFGSGKIVVYKEKNRDKNIITVKSCIEICSECNGSGFGKTQIPELYTEHDVKTAFGDGYQAGMEAAQPKWISVEEALPEVSDLVLVIANGKPKENIELINACLIASFWGDEGWTADGFDGWDKLKVTHWTPLPPEPVNTITPKEAD